MSKKSKTKRRHEYLRSHYPGGWNMSQNPLPSSGEYVEPEPESYVDAQAATAPSEKDIDLSRFYWPPVPTAENVEETAKAQRMKISQRQGQ